MLRIKEFSKQTRISIRRLRHYDAIDLLKPSVRAISGHRQYSDEDMTRASKIHFLRECLHLPLQEIRQFLLLEHKGDHAAMLELLGQQLEATKARIEQLEAIRKNIKGFMSREEDETWFAEGKKLREDRIAINIGIQLVSLVTEKRNGHLLQGIQALREELHRDHGIIVPPIRVRDHIKVKSFDFSIETIEGDILCESVASRAPRSQKIRQILAAVRQFYVSLAKPT